MIRTAVSFSRILANKLAMRCSEPLMKKPLEDHIKSCRLWLPIGLIIYLSTKPAIVHQLLYYSQPFFINIHQQWLLDSMGSIAHHQTACTRPAKDDQRIPTDFSRNESSRIQGQTPGAGRTHHSGVGPKNAASAFLLASAFQWGCHGLSFPLTLSFFPGHTFPTPQFDASIWKIMSGFVGLCRIKTEKIRFDYWRHQRPIHTSRRMVDMTDEIRWTHMMREYARIEMQMPEVRKDEEARLWVGWG